MNETEARALLAALEMRDEATAAARELNRYLANDPPPVEEIVATAQALADNEAGYRLALDTLAWKGRPDSQEGKA